ncbi:LacI family DNA-binding transcriptional regulator [Thalassotalea maritima]|uniref:LacI family DNA-binding transcriptional regulator n=1 Tax=Thalassotalea maritima TaxID=3242416 RepID=UPI003528C678
MATIYEVSKLAGVSLATVSRVMNKNAKVSEKTRDKVLQAMEQLGYRPNSIARSLASNRSSSIGVMVAELHGPFFGSMMSGIEAECRAAGKHVIITTGHSNEASEKEGIEFLVSRSCDAIIVHSEALSDEYLITLSQSKTPIYIVSRYIDQLTDHCVSLDNKHGGYLATKALINQGHKDIVYISGPEYKDDAKQRLQGHKQALAEHNIAFDETSVFYGDFQETGGVEGLSHFLKQKREFSAVACGNDEMASGAMKCAREHGFRLPEELSIIGFDDVMFANYLYPRLTTIHNPIADMGRSVTRMVLRDIYGQAATDIKQVFEPTLILRDSVSIKR